MAIVKIVRKVKGLPKEQQPKLFWLRSRSVFNRPQDLNLNIGIGSAIKSNEGFKGHTI